MTDSFRARGAVLRVKHQGLYTMVGLVFDFEGRQVFYHVARENKRHFLTDSFGGIDACVLDYLEAQGVDLCYHAIKDTTRAYWARTEYVRKYGILEDWGGRSRYFLPRFYWVESVTLEVPWIKREVVLGEEEGAEPVGA